MTDNTLTPRPGLTAARERRGFSQSELARRSGVHRVQLARYESGDMTPSVDTALTIARALRTSAEKVWGLDISAPGTEAGRTSPEETPRGAGEST